MSKNFMEPMYHRVTCELCVPMKSWWSKRPNKSKRKHVRLFHPESYGLYRHANELGDVR